MKSQKLYSWKIIMLAVVFGVLPLGAALGSTVWAFGYDDYAIVLETYVNDQGMVSYKGLKAEGKRLDTFAVAR